MVNGTITNVNLYAEKEQATFITSLEAILWEEIYGIGLGVVPVFPY